MSTVSFTAETVERNWRLVDLEGQVLGRAASQIATILRGKDKATFTPHADVGDYVIVVNAEKVRLTGNKLADKLYHRHTGYMGGLKTTTAGEMLETKPEELIKKAVWGMLPKGPLGRRQFKKLKVYTGSDHPHEAQKPQPVDLSAR